jgi:hypothetical protein
VHLLSRLGTDENHGKSAKNTASFYKNSRKHGKNTASKYHIFIDRAINKTVLAQFFMTVWCGSLNENYSLSL